MGTTDSSGNVSCTVIVNQTAGPKTLVITFAGDAFYVGSSRHGTITVQ